MKKLIEEFAKNIFNIEIKLVKKDENFKSDGKFRYYFPVGNSYLFFYNQTIDKKKLYFLKRFIDELLKREEKYINESKELEILKKEIHNVIASFDKNFKKNDKCLYFSFLEKNNVSYALFENDELICNKNLDKFTIDIYKKRLEKESAVSLSIKDGELYALKIENYKIILLSKEKLSNFIEDIIKLRLIFLTHTYAIEDNIYRDKLTSLYNRYKFLIDIKRKDDSAIFVNIKNFKRINKLYGSDIGDRVLKEIVKRLKHILKNEAIYRILSDRFAILIEPDFLTKELLNSIKMILKKEFSFYSYKIEDFIKFKIDMQIVYFKQIPKDIIEKANFAFRKSSDDVIDFKNVKKILDEEEKDYDILIEAVKKDDISPFFQRVIKNNFFRDTAYYEALMRIKYKEKTLSPFNFIKVAKDNGLYGKLNFIMIEKSIKAVDILNSIVSINVDMYDILEENFFEKLKFILRKNEINGRRVQIEILETEDIYKNYSDLEKFLQNVKELGCRIALDDFGSGYSNFSEIKDLPIDTLKIDMSLVKEVVKSEKEFSILETIANLSKTLNFKTTAEGVGNYEIYKKIKDLPIDYFQGFYFAKPKSLKDIIKENYEK